MRFPRTRGAFGLIVLSFVLLGASAHCQPQASSQSLTTPQKVLVIGHRGASGERPEHTLAAYRLAMEQGADFVEPDLVITRDGVLVARHEPNLIATTDVGKRPEFAQRRRMKTVDGRSEEGYFVEDFTLAELKTLRALQPRAYRDQSYNGLYEIPTFGEVIELVKEYERETGRKVGIYPETKHPSYFREQGLALEERLLATLTEHAFTDPQRVFIQSFEVGNLKDILAPLLRAQNSSIPLVQLFGELDAQPFDYRVQGRQETYRDLIQPESLRSFVATYARGIGPWKASFVLRTPAEQAIDLNGDGRAESTERLTGEVLPVVRDAHAAGLLVHVYTLRDEERYLAIGYADAAAEYQALLSLGVDGFFTDFPATARRTIDGS